MLKLSFSACSRGFSAHRLRSKHFPFGLSYALSKQERFWLMSHHHHLLIMYAYLTLLNNPNVIGVKIGVFSLFVDTFPECTHITKTIQHQALQEMIKKNF